jgi:hemoglobin-like flavoprotein
MANDAATRIRDSFNALAPQGDTLMTVFYDKLFHENAGVRSLFPDDMNGQKKALLGAVALVVKHADDFDAIEDALHQMGARHVAYGTTAAHYPIVRDTLLASLREVAGDLWNDQLEQDWAGALNAVAGAMIAGAEHEQSKAA